MVAEITFNMTVMTFSVSKISSRGTPCEKKLIVFYSFFTSYIYQVEVYLRGCTGNIYQMQRL